MYLRGNFIGPFKNKQIRGIYTRVKPKGILRKTVQFFLIQGIMQAQEKGLKGAVHTAVNGIYCGSPTMYEEQTYAQTSPHLPAKSQPMARRIEVYMFFTL